jgi:hypothetical protein
MQALYDPYFSANLISTYPWPDMCKIWRRYHGFLKIGMGVDIYLKDPSFHTALRVSQDLISWTTVFNSQRTFPPCHFLKEAVNVWTFLQAPF